MPNRIFIWPGEPPPEMDGLPVALAENLDGTEIITLQHLEDFHSTRDAALAGDALIVQVGSVLPPAFVACLAVPHLNSVSIVSDDFLGTDGADFSRATAAGSAVAAVRSLAVQRGSTSRANAVCVPSSMFGGASELRGPLAAKVEPYDIVQAVLFFLSDECSYLNGQLLFVNGGRHLFSSMSA